MHELNPMGRVFAEIIALRLVTQRLLKHFTLNTADPAGVLQQEHKLLLLDLEWMEINDSDPERAEAIRAHAERVIDEMCTTMVEGTPPDLNWGKKR